MDTTPPAGLDQDAASRPTRVWRWRDTSGDGDVPRAHGIGWASDDGSSHGRLTLHTEHLRLDPNHIANC